MISKNLRTGLLLFSAVLELLFLCTRYSHHLGDFSGYLQAGQLLAKHQDPYSHTLYANSPVSAYFLYLISKFSFLFRFPASIQLLNLCGVILFIRIFFSNFAWDRVLAIMALLLGSNVTRALFADVQVTGIVLGLLAISISKLNSSRLSTLVSILSAWFAFELKAQIAIPFLLLLVIKSTSRSKIFFSVLGLILSSHLLIDFFLGHIYEIAWLHRISEYSSNSYKIGFEISIWKMMAITFGLPLFWKAISTIVAVLYLFRIWKVRDRDFKIPLTLSLCFPFLNSYSHLYDYLGILLAVLVSTQKKLLLLQVTLLSFFMVFPLSFRALVVTVALQSLVAWFSFWGLDSKRIFRSILVSFCIDFLVYLVSTKSSQEFQIGLSFFLSVTFFVFISAFSEDRTFKQS